jgi:hypothetical protein
VAAYYWRVDAGVPSSSFATEDGWTQLDQNRVAFDIDSAAFDSDGEHFVSIVAVNNAGMASTPLVASLTPEDLTPPFGTAFCVGQHSAPGQLFLAFSSAARDPESGIRGYQYRVRGEGETIIRDWAEDLEVTDFTTVYAGGKVVTASLTLLDGASYYVDVRAINGQGLREVVTSGPIKVDYSPPPTPTAEVLAILGYTPPLAAGEGKGEGKEEDRAYRVADPYNTGLVALERVRLSIQVVAPDDPQSGLWRHQWEVVQVWDPSDIQYVASGTTNTVQPGGAQGDTAATGGAAGLRGLRGTTGFGSSGGTSASSPPHGTIPGAQAGSYSAILTSDELRHLNQAAPGATYELRIRTINSAGVASAVHKVRFALPGGEEARKREEVKKGAGR